MFEVKYITKRDGRQDPFNPEKIKIAILKAMAASEDGKGEDVELADFLTAQVGDTLDHLCRQRKTETISVKEVHDTVENALIKSKRPLAGKEYIRYRHQRNLARKVDTKEIYDSIYGEFSALMEEARSAESNDDRFVLEAKAEAVLLDTATMIPNTTQGGAYTISRVAPRTVPYVQWGNDDDRWHGMIISLEWSLSALNISP